MKNISATEETKDLYNALKKRGIISILEYWDGAKHVDICIKKARLFIEVDGLQHAINPKQIITDLKRDHYSCEDGFSTMRIPNEIIKKHLDSLADAIAEVAKKRSGIGN
jgi:very-short-patch-repair endonuclease